MLSEYSRSPFYNYMMMRMGKKHYRVCRMAEGSIAGGSFSICPADLYQQFIPTALQCGGYSVIGHVLGDDAFAAVGATKGKALAGAAITVEHFPGVCYYSWELKSGTAVCEG